MPSCIHIVWNTHCHKKRCTKKNCPNGMKFYICENSVHISKLLLSDRKKDTYIIRKIENEWWFIWAISSLNAGCGTRGHWRIQIPYGVLRHFIHCSSNRDSTSAKLVACLIFPIDPRYARLVTNLGRRHSRIRWRRHYCESFALCS